MMQETDEHLSFEELKEMCGGFFSDEILKEFYSSATGISWNRTCPFCQLEETRFNNHLFYSGRTTACRACCLVRIRKINEVKRLKRLAIRQEKKKKKFTSSVGSEP
jgi:L-lactate utilization protein LutB